MLHLRVRMEAGRIGERRENLSEKGRRWGHYGASLVGSAIHYCWTNRQKILLDTAWPSHGSRDREGAGSGINAGACIRTSRTLVACPASPYGRGSAAGSSTVNTEPLP